MSKRKGAAEITLPHMSVRAAGRALGETTFRVHGLMGEGVLRGVKVIDAAGGTLLQVDAESVREELARREAQKAAA